MKDDVDPTVAYKLLAEQAKKKGHGQWTREEYVKAASDLLTLSGQAQDPMDWEIIKEDAGQQWDRRERARLAVRDLLAAYSNGDSLTDPIAELVAAFERLR